jgi:hypothetical protein
VIKKQKKPKPRPRLSARMIVAGMIGAMIYAAAGYAAARPEFGVRHR